MLTIFKGKIIITLKSIADYLSDGNIIAVPIVYTVILLKYYYYYCHYYGRQWSIDVLLLLHNKVLQTNRTGHMLMTRD